MAAMPDGDPIRALQRLREVRRACARLPPGIDPLTALEVANALAASGVASRSTGLGVRALPGHRDPRTAERAGCAIRSPR